MKKQPKKQPKNAVEELKDEVGNFIALETVYKSEGGKILVDALVSDIFSAIDSLANNVQTLTHIEMVAIICKLKERLDIVKVLTGAKSHKEVCEELLEEELKKEEENTPSET